MPTGLYKCLRLHSTYRLHIDRSSVTTTTASRRGNPPARLHTTITLLSTTFHEATPPWPLVNAKATPVSRQKYPAELSTGAAKLPTTTMSYLVSHLKYPAETTTLLDNYPAEPTREEFHQGKSHTPLTLLSRHSSRQAYPAELATLLSSTLKNLQRQKSRLAYPAEHSRSHHAYPAEPATLLSLLPCCATTLLCYYPAVLLPCCATTMLCYYHAVLLPCRRHITPSLPCCNECHCHLGERLLPCWHGLTISKDVLPTLLSPSEHLKVLHSPVTLPSTGARKTKKKFLACGGQVPSLTTLLREKTEHETGILPCGTMVSSWGWAAIRPWRPG